MIRMNKVLDGHKYVANFLDAPVSVGMVYRLDDTQFLPALHFNDVYPEVDLSRWTSSGSKGLVKFLDSSDVSITIGGSATTNYGKTELELIIKHSKTAVGALQDVNVEALRYENVLSQLQDLWKKRGFDRYRREYVFVFEIARAASGTLIYSKSSNNKIVLKHKMDTPVSSAIDLASGAFEYVSNTKRTLEIIRQVVHTPLFKAFRFRRSWEPEVLG